MTIFGVQGGDDRTRLVFRAMNFDERVAECEQRMVERRAGEIVFDLFDGQTIAGGHDVVFGQLIVGDPDILADNHGVSRYGLRAGRIARGDWSERFAFVAGGDVVDLDLTAVGGDDQSAAGGDRG